MKLKFILPVIIAAALYACSQNEPLPEFADVISDNTAAAAASGDARSGLYHRVEGLSGLKLKTAADDLFNLRFSHTAHFYYEDIYVEITSDLTEAEIYYTTDGSDPKQGVSTRSNRQYTGEPVRIMAESYNEPVVLRAAAFLDGGVSSDILTHTYFVSTAIDSRFDDNLYVFMITSDPVNLYDYDNGILVEGRLREEFRRANPGRDIVPPDPANFNIRGREGERPAYIEVLSAKGELLISQSAGIRVRGGWSRDASRKSLALYARNEYDPIFDKFYYDFFRFFDFNGRTTVRGTDIPVESYTQLVLRNGGNDRGGAHMREEFTQVLAKKAGFLDYKEVAPAAVFINGVYYGFFWLQQMYPEYYFFDHYGQTAKSSLDIIYWWDIPDGRGVIDDEVFLEYSKIMDIDNFIQYFALEIYASNWDWPHNNMKAWRYSGGEGGEYINKYYDGKYRMLLFDVESWGLGGQSAGERTIGRTRDSSAPFRNLMQREDMVEKFCNQMWDFINSIFTYNSISNIHSQIVDLYDAEMRFAIRNNAASMSSRGLERERESILTFSEARTDHVIRDMERSFGIDGDVYHVSVTGKAGASILLNTLELHGAGTLYSSYFTEHSVKLSADTAQFDHWLINGQRYETKTVTLSGRVAQNSVIRAELFLN
ncbi:MAG: CotH kinase family protein [Oscillospiraceae bacterium]|nr:CotH kinase family protein [Oscillospiraceae bacterium]